MILNNSFQQRTDFDGGRNISVFPTTWNLHKLIVTYFNIILQKMSISLDGITGLIKSISLDTADGEKTENVSYGSWMYPGIWSFIK